MARGPVWCLFLPPDGAECSLEHPANADRRRTRMERQGSVLQQSLGLSGAVPLAQIVEPCWTVIPLCPQLAVSQLACDRPTVRAVPLAAQLDLLHRAIELSRLPGINAIFNFHDYGSASSCKR